MTTRDCGIASINGLDESVKKFLGESLVLKTEKRKAHSTQINQADTNVIKLAKGFCREAKIQRIIRYDL